MLNLQMFLLESKGQLKYVTWVLQELCLPIELWLTMLQLDGTDRLNSLLEETIMIGPLISGLLDVLWQKWLMDNHFFQDKTILINSIWFKSVLDL